MTEKVKPIPEGFHTLTPYLVVREAAKALDFYQRAFGAQVKGVHRTPDGKIMNAQLRIGDSVLMLNDEFPGKCLAPPSLGGTPVSLHVYVEDVDQAFSRAVASGATVTMPLMDAFWGDRYGQVEDPFGHRWFLATHKENLSEEEIQRRGAVAFAEMAKQARSKSQTG